LAEHANILVISYNWSIIFRYFYVVVTSSAKPHHCGLFCITLKQSNCFLLLPAATWVSATSIGQADLNMFHGSQKWNARYLYGLGFGMFCLCPVKLVIFLNLQLPAQN
jgi:hypothetical protein